MATSQRSEVAPVAELSAAQGVPLSPSNSKDHHSDIEDGKHLPHEDEKSEIDLGTAAAPPPKGVAKVQAFNKVLYQSGRKGKLLLWLLAISVFLTMFVYALDQGITTAIITPIATSSFGNHSELAAVSTASQIIRAISKPFIGKMSDVTSRPTTYVVVLVFYLVGFIIAACAHNIATYAVAISLAAVGKSGLDLLSDIIVADLTSLEWRGFAGSILSVPFIVTVPINGFIATGVANENWRWGFGMFCIMIPVLLVPAIWTLYVIQARGKKMGMVTMAGSKAERTTGELVEKRDAKTWLQVMWQGCEEIDVIGLILLGFAFSLILLPFSLYKQAKDGWHNPSMIAMLVTGFVILGLFIAWERLLAPNPLMSDRIMRNRAFVAAVIIDVFNQLSSSVRATYWSSFIWVTKDWSSYGWTMFLGITTIGLCLMSPIVGLLHRCTHRYKNMMFLGTVGKIAGYGILINAGSNTMTYATGRIVMSQLLLCLGSFSVVGARVGSQASVAHEDLATVIYLLSLWSTLGSSVGSAISSAIWTETMLDRMRKALPTTDEATLTKLYGSITAVHKYPYNSEIRQGVIRAYEQTNGYIAITALVCASIPLVATMFMPNYYLGKQHNAVTNKNLAGEDVYVPRLESEEKTQKKWWEKMRDAYRKDC